jgi:hypothetical protein
MMNNINPKIYLMVLDDMRTKLSDFMIERNEFTLH